MVQRGRRRDHGNCLLRELVPLQSPMAARGCGRVVGWHAPALCLPPPHRGAAAVGGAHAAVAGDARLSAVAWPARRAMIDFDHNAIDEVLQSRVRIAIVAFLASAGEVDFTDIRDAIRTTDGNASVHLRKLEDAGYVVVDKRFVERRPQSRYALTDRGRKALLDHVAHLERLLRPCRPPNDKGR